MTPVHKAQRVIPEKRETPGHRVQKGIRVQQVPRVRRVTPVPRDRREIPAIPGPKGETGSGFKVLDYYSTQAALEAAVTGPNPGDAYGVGTAEPYNIYIYSPSKGWVNNGPLQGAKGDTGPQGPKGDTGDTGPQGPKATPARPVPRDPRETPERPVHRVKRATRGRKA